MINLGSGTIESDDGKLRIYRGMWLSELLYSCVENNIIAKPRKDLPFLFQILPQYIDKHQCVIRALCENWSDVNGIISQVHISLYHDYGHQPTWDDWTREGMEQDKRDHDNWLQKVYRLKPWTTFKWGTIRSVLDTKGGSSFIAIDYNN